MFNESVIKHIWDFSNSLSCENHTKRLLKSYYINTCRAIVRNESPYTGEMCAHCALFWSESEYSLKLIPQSKLTLSSKSKKLIAKLDEAEKTQVQGLLNKKQKKRAKWLRKRAKCQLQIHCNFCQHKSTLPLEKPKKVNKLENATCAQPTKPIKKKKRKDKTAGLKLPVVALPQKSVAKSKQSVAKTKTQGKKLATSKTQQQNTLLQLAEMLKKQSTSNKNSLNSFNALFK